jgi:tRNA 2-thiouridine synthesizing protein A
MTGESEPAVLDARGLLCPLPVIRTQDRVRTLTPGARLEILATDPGVLADLPAWCRVHGHTLLAADTLPAAADDRGATLYRILVQVES